MMNSPTHDRQNQTPESSKVEQLNPEYYRVYRGNTLYNNVVELIRLENEKKEIYWHVVFRNGQKRILPDREVKVIQTHVNSEQAQDVLAYMREVAANHQIRKDDNTASQNGEDEFNKEEQESLLLKKYVRLGAIDTCTAAACYVSPETIKNKVLKNRQSAESIIFPFGTNASQKLAVYRAFERQISIVQGPPGTGKTQTILNLLANIIVRGQRALVVSSNNSAVENIYEKLEASGFHFFCANVGNVQKIQLFMQNQEGPPQDIATWQRSQKEKNTLVEELKNINVSLDKVYTLQSRQAELRQEANAIALEHEHFRRNVGDISIPALRVRPTAKRLMHLWLSYQMLVDKLGENTSSSRLWTKLKLKYYAALCRIRLGVRSSGHQQIIKELKALYYELREDELKKELAQVKLELKDYDSQTLSQKLKEHSLQIFRSALYERYKDLEWVTFEQGRNISYYADAFTSQYPIVLSSAFSADKFLFDQKYYDYIIIDEASQLSSEVGMLACTCAKNAVIVGDNLQLEHVVTNQSRIELEQIKAKYTIADAYDCVKYSFLSSVSQVITDAPQTLLREHYRCHPRIINYCNQKFYGGQLLIMTEDKGEPDVLRAIKTPPGNHATKNHYNQREIDVIREEALPLFDNDSDSVGVISPYRDQTLELSKQFADLDLEVNTIHKYQGREKDAIIMSAVDNQITDFLDKPSLLNVAVSRAKNKFCIVLSGNEQERQGNITDLIDYIIYNNGQVSQSKVASIFDYLYTQYTEQRIEFLQKNDRISHYASENLTYQLIQEVLQSDSRYASLHLVCHVPLSELINDPSLLSPQELRYLSQEATHVDFLIISQVSKKPMLVVETDGYSYHKQGSRQHERDKLKDNILAIYDIPLIRLSTKGSGEREKILSQLNKIIN